MGHLDKFFAVALGFNLISMSRKTNNAATSPQPINQSQKTFHGVLLRMAQEENNRGGQAVRKKAVVLNPVILILFNCDFEFCDNSFEL